MGRALIVLVLLGCPKPAQPVGPPEPTEAVAEIELFSDADYKGVRQIVFMSEWSAGSLVKISDWHMQDRLSSVRWIDLDDTLHIELYEHSNGTGKRYQNILRRAARGTPEGLTNLKGQSVNDIISAFKIFQSPPEIEKI